jgi:hypothetical protein
VIFLAVFGGGVAVHFDFVSGDEVDFGSYNVLFKFREHLHLVAQIIKEVVNKPKRILNQIRVLRFFT